VSSPGAAGFRRIGLTPTVCRALERAVNQAGSQAEVCGILTGTATDSRTAIAHAVVPLPNISQRPLSFEIDTDVFAQERARLHHTGHTVLALYHSHPSGSTQPSTRDLEIPKIAPVLSMILARNENRMHAACYGCRQGQIVPVQVLAPYNPLA